MISFQEIFKELSNRPSSHAATITLLPNGNLMVAWYAGSYEGAPDVAILQSKFSHKRNYWSQPKIFVDTPGKCDGNPVLFVDKRKRVWLFFVTMYGRDWSTCKIKCIISEDCGETWSAIRILRDEFGWMVRTKPLTLRNGAILLPVYDEVRWCSKFMISYDSGVTWEVHGDVCVPDGSIQPAVVELSDGALLAYMRTRSGYIWKTLSFDHGITWSRPEPTPLKNPNSSIDLIKLHNGNLLLVFNDSSSKRTPLSVAISEDEGETWPYKRDIETGEGEYSYPSAIQTPDGLIHVVYTNRRINIKHAVIDERWIRGY